MKSRRRWIGLVLGVALALAVGGLVWALWPRPAVAPAPIIPVASPAAELPPAELAAYRELSPRMRQAAAQTRALVQLGEERERNLLTIRGAQADTEERLAAVDALSATAPDRFGPAMTAYEGGARAVRAAMAEAQAAFPRLDWDRVARATETMARGAGEIERAVTLLDAAVGVPVNPPAERPGPAEA